MAKQNNSKEPPKISMSNTKKEILDAYQELIVLYKEKEKEALDAKKIAKEKAKEAKKSIADDLDPESVIEEMDDLKLDVNKLIDKLSQNLSSQIKEYLDVKEATRIRENELEEIYDIEKEAGTLAALVNANNKKREEFEEEMAEKKQKLQEELDELEEKIAAEKKQHEKEMQRKREEAEKEHQRKMEEFEYEFERKKKLKEDEFEDKKRELEKELKEKREKVESELQEREERVAAKEDRLEKLEQQVAEFPDRLEAEKVQAIEDATEKLKMEHQNELELTKQKYEGKIDVLETKLESYQETVTDQQAKIKELSDKIEKAYQKVQDVALKAIEGASGSKSFQELQQILGQSTKKKKEE
jgi:SAM-dependent methyltransferase